MDRYQELSRHGNARNVSLLHKRRGVGGAVINKKGRLTSSFGGKEKG